MTNQVFSPSRRDLLAGLGGTAIAAGLRLPASAQGARLSLRARPRTIPLQAGGTGMVVWMLETDQAGPLRFARGDLAVTLLNELPAPIALNWFGIDGASMAEPLTGQTPVPPGGQASFTLPLRLSGTFLVSMLVPGGSALPTASRALIVEDNPPVAADHDEVLLIEEWQREPSATAAPGTARDAPPAAVYTVNGQRNFSINMRGKERLRLRFINGRTRSPIGLKIENHEVRVMAIDGAPAEPFMARDGQLVLAPGSRTDVFIDATRAPGTVSQIILHDGTSPQTIAHLEVSDAAPVRAALLPPAAALPSGNLPARLNLQGALRAELSLDPNTQWITPAAFAATTASAFKVKRGRTVVLAIANSTAAPAVFRLHGHHFRLLDRLDDGWKPYWLDTLMLDKGQTQRIAFAAEHPGRWLVEATGLNPAAPKLLRCYVVE